jgi:hypothetical protein
MLGPGEGLPPSVSTITGQEEKKSKKRRKRKGQ